MITGFNPADMYCGRPHQARAAHVPRRVLRHREFTIHKEFVSSKIPGKTAEPPRSGARSDLDFTAETGLVAILHNDIDMPFPKPGQEPWIVPQFRDLMSAPAVGRDLGARGRRRSSPGEGSARDDGTGWPIRR
jgi:hypothetical protein